MILSKILFCVCLDFNRLLTEKESIKQTTTSYIGKFCTKLCPCKTWFIYLIVKQELYQVFQLSYLEILTITIPKL